MHMCGAVSIEHGMRLGVQTFGRFPFAFQITHTESVNMDPVSRILSRALVGLCS
jgi:hypothetical protein